MAASVSFNGKDITQKLDLLAQVQLPFIAQVTLNGLATQVRQDLQKEMQDSFRHVTKFTLNSVRQNHPAKKTELWTEVFHLDKATKGNAAADYLRPQIVGSMVYQTRFQWRLKSQVDGYNGRYMLPLHDSKGAKRDATGRIRPSQYVEALYGIKAFEDVRASVKSGRYRTEGSYMYFRKSTGKSKSSNRKGPTQYKGPGIYRVMGKTIVQVFRQLDSVPTVQKSYDFKFAAQDSVNKNADRIFNQALALALRKP